METKEYRSYEIDEYVSRLVRGKEPDYAAVTMETVAKEITDHDFMRFAFNQPEGKLLLNTIIKVMSSSLSMIVSLCTKNGDQLDISESIKPHAYRMHVAYMILTDWANTFQKGVAHIHEATKKRREEKE